MNKRIHKEMYGNTERMCFSKIKEPLEIPYLIEVQKDSYRAFINDGIRDVFEDFSPIVDFSNHFELYFLDYTLEGKSKYSEKECRDRDATYGLPLRVKVRLVCKDSGKVIDQDVFMGEFPLMTDNGSFIINGAERVIVSQLVRSPGVYCGKRLDKTGKDLFDTTVIPNRGAWLEFEQDSGETHSLSVKVDRTRKLTSTVLLRAVFRFLSSNTVETRGANMDQLIRDYYANDSIMVASCDKDSAKTESESLVELYKRLRPGEVPTEDAVKLQLNNLLFDYKRYDLARVGRYKFNKKLNLATRIVGCKLSRDAVSADGEVIAAKGDVLDLDTAKAIQNAGINDVFVVVEDPNTGENIEHKIIGNHTVSFYALTGVNPRIFKLLEFVHYPSYCLMEQCAMMAREGASVEQVAESKKAQLNKILFIDEKMEDQKADDFRILREKVVSASISFFRLLERLQAGETIELSHDELRHLAPVFERLNQKHITADDIAATISYNISLRYGIGSIDNIDHLGNRRVRSVGELLQNQFRIGMARLERVIKERMATQEQDEVTPQTLINIRPVTSAIKEFFGSSQLSQFMDQTNPIAELTHKRKLSALGPGGLNRERATFDVRDVHHSHYGRICPIETPEGQNIGLISSLSTFARINEFGFIETPYRKVLREEVDGKTVCKVTDDVYYLAADEEDKYTVAQANEPLDANGDFVHERVTCRRREDIIELPKEEIDYMDVSPKQLVSVATALIPFLENDDTNRALMGSNMQRQAVPLLKPEAAIVATGIEHRIAYDSGVMIIAKRAGFVKYVDATTIIIETEDGEQDRYEMTKFTRSNQGTCINQRPIVSKGEKIAMGQVIADGPSTDKGELALGRNILIGFMSWEGYNYEDAILISQKLVREDVFTSIHIEEHEIEARDTKLGNEEITRDIPNVGDDALKDLDEDGIIRIGAEVHAGDILVGKVTPKGETELTPEERLLRAIFGEKAREVRDTSLRVPHGEGGVVVDVKIFTRENRDELSPGVSKLVRVYIAQKRKIGVGDKMAGRHGNKGVISRVLAEEDMPFLADGTPLQIVLNPLGVPSRMNIGQVLEVHLGLVARCLGWKISTPVFDGANESDIHDLLKENGFVNPNGEVDGKIQLYDGRTGEPFENRVTVGQM
ncbi:MAG: DNA-directed RNA polymerase subunit beta, partial [Clostridia bacterium]|nr:DNA-directed RNA polymerase subunit beta [Clostridia bacterium]